MQRTRVEFSTNVWAAGWQDSAEGGILEVEFNNGGIYQYIDVPQSVYALLMRAPSKGRFLHECVKPNYECRKVAAGVQAASQEVGDLA